MTSKSSRKKSSVKSKVKKVLKKKVVKPTAKSLSNELLEWVKENHGREAAKVAIEKFGVSYAHLTDWLKKEGVQAREAVETLIESRKKAAIKKGEGSLKSLAKSIREKKAELKKLTDQLKAAAKKK